jgi:hypothetical protein
MIFKLGKSYFHYIRLQADYQMAGNHFRSISARLILLGILVRGSLRKMLCLLIAPIADISG